MSKVNSQSQSGSASFDFPVQNSYVPVPNAARQSGNWQEGENEGVLQKTNSQALTKRSEVEIRANRGSNAQGQSQITQADWAEVDQVVVPVGVAVED